MATVSERDRAVMNRQTKALIELETDEIGGEDERLELINRLDSQRSDFELPAIKTESELHRKAKQRGLLRG